MGAPNTLEKILARILIGSPDECWEWAGPRDRQGYGKVWFGNRPRLAHRLAYEILSGPIPAGAMLLHSCDNPPCCNPAHLRPGDNDANMADMVARGRSRAGRGADVNREKTHCKHGHEFTPENTYVWTNSKGWRFRVCRACNRRNVAARKARVQAGAR